MNRRLCQGTNRPPWLANKFLCTVKSLRSMKRYLSKSDGPLCLDKIKHLCEIKPYRLCLSEFWG